ncbi:hypothetical protein GCM10023088_11620 [Actinomadura verrucosospora]
MEARRGAEMSVGMLRGRRAERRMFLGRAPRATAVQVSEPGAGAAIPPGGDGRAKCFPCGPGAWQDRRLEGVPPRTRAQAK